MLTLTEILDNVYDKLSLSETINRTPIKTELPKREFSEIWEIKTEIEVGSFQKEVTMFIAFEDFFPLTIPCIYLSKECFENIYPIPHVDKNRFVCTFHTDSLILDVDKPFEIVCVCLQKAKKIIKEGLEGSNHDDFRDELKAYWTDEEDSDIIHYLSLLPDFPKETTLLKICKLIPTYNLIKYVIYRNSKDLETKKTLDFILSKCSKGIESEILFLGDYTIDDKPPFPKNNEEILNSINPSSLALFKQYINSKTSEKHIFFTAKTSSKSILLGWKHKTLITKRNGFRQGALTPYDVFLKYQKNDIIERLFVNEYSNNRIENRTSGIIHDKFTFLVAGLGSIGSNIIYFLNGLNYPNFKLIDDDVLKLENIGRHLLGIDNINSFKTNELKSYIKNIRPDQDVSIKTSKIETIATNHIDYFNDCSYAFISIGNQNIENYLLRRQKEKAITIPMFFLWVEPYAIGGHCLFIHPDDIIELNDLYEKHLYRFNIIDSAEYINSNPILSRQEAGCQTSYVPYSGNDIILFLSSIYKWINDIVKNKSKRSVAMQWTGNINHARELGLTINNSYCKNESFNSNLFYLNDYQKK